MRDVSSKKLELDFQTLFADAVKVVFVGNNLSGMRKEMVPVLITSFITTKLDVEIAERKSVVADLESVAESIREEYLRNVQRKKELMKVGLLEAENTNDDPLDEKNEVDIPEEAKIGLAAAIKRKEDILGMLDRASIFLEKTDQGISCRYVLNTLMNAQSTHAYDAQHTFLLDSFVKKIKVLAVNKKDSLRLLLTELSAGSVFEELSISMLEIFKTAGIEQAMNAEEYLKILLGCLPDDISQLKKLEKSMNELMDFFSNFDGSGEIAYQINAFQGVLIRKLEKYTKNSAHQNGDAAVVILRDEEAVRSEMEIKKQALIVLNDKSKEESEIKSEIQVEIYKLAGEIHRIHFNKVLEKISHSLKNDALFFIDHLLDICNYVGKKNEHSVVNILKFIEDASSKNESLVGKNLEDQIIDEICQSNDMHVKDLSDHVKLSIKYSLFNMAATFSREVIEERRSIADKKKKTPSLKMLFKNAAAVSKFEDSYQKCLEQIMKVSNLCDVQREIQEWATAALEYQESKSKQVEDESNFSRVLKKGTGKSFREESSACLESIIGGVHITAVQIAEDNPDTVMNQLREFQALYEVHQQYDQAAKKLAALACEFFPNPHQQRSGSLPDKKEREKSRSPSSSSAAFFSSRESSRRGSEADEKQQANEGVVIAAANGDHEMESGRVSPSALCE